MVTPRNVGAIDGFNYYRLVSCLILLMKQGMSSISEYINLNQFVEIFTRSNSGVFRDDYVCSGWLKVHLRSRRDTFSQPANLAKLL